MSIINLYLKEREREREREKKEAHRIASYIPLIWTPNPVGIQFKEQKQNNDEKCAFKRRTL